MKCAECSDRWKCGAGYDLRRKRRSCEKAKKPVKRSNADRIRSMTDEELVKQFAVEMGFCCPVKGVDCSLEPDCRVCFARWLKKEVSDA